MRPRTHRFRDLFDLSGDKFTEDSFMFFESVRTCAFNGDEPGFHYYNNLGIITDNALNGEAYSWKDRQSALFYIWAHKLYTIVRPPT